MRQIKTASYIKKSQQNPNILDNRLKQQINSDLSNSGFDGNGIFERIGQGLIKIHEILNKNNIDIENVLNANLFLGDEGRRTFDLIWSANETDPFTPGQQIENSMLAFTWYKRPSENYELIAYLS